MRRLAVELSMDLNSVFRDFVISSRRFAMVVLASPTFRLSSRVSKMSETDMSCLALGHAECLRKEQVDLVRSECQLFVVLETVLRLAVSLR